MIPKRIFMVWLGNAVPAYAHMAVDMFRRAYAEYDIEFIRYKVEDLRQIRDGCVNSDIDNAMHSVMHEVFDLGKSSRYSGYIENQHMIYGKNMKNIMLLSDIFRLELLNTFGGVYIDVDSAPGRFFDDELLSKDRFCVCRVSGKRTIPDNYFMGQSDGFQPWLNPMDPNSAAQISDLIEHDIMFKYRRAKFIKAEHVHAKSNFYIEHYMVRSWESMDGLAIDDFDA